MASEIVFLITEQRNKQRITLPAGSYRFGRSAQCEYVLRRNNVGEVQFVVACTKDGWTVTDSSTECVTWYDNRYLNQGETCPLQEGDVLGLNTDGNTSTQEITFRVEEIRTAQSGETGLRQEQLDFPVPEPPTSTTKLLGSISKLVPSTMFNGLPVLRFLTVLYTLSSCTLMPLLCSW